MKRPKQTRTLPQNNKKRENRPSLALISLFLAYALVVGIIENRIPFDSFVPGVKLGLANVVVLTALYLFPLRDTLKIVLLKCVVSAVSAGTGFSFLYSLSGALFSFLVMALLIRLCGGRFSPVGVSIAGAVAHNFGQILVASAVMRTFAVAFYLPALLVSGVITGILVGAAAQYLIRLTERHARYAFRSPR